MYTFPQLNQSMLTHTIVIPTRSAGQILGKGGEIIRTLRSTTGCHISIEEENELRPGERVVTLTGHLPGITAASQFILSQLSAQRGVAPMPQDSLGDTNDISQQAIFS
jgi:transcription antitermination factor NusA-like protein